MNAKSQKTSSTPGARQVCLPVIEALEVKGYPLYPGSDNKDGLTHEFDDGVTVIAGINGQGKTTLLNVIYRILVGSWDQSKADYNNPGKKQHKLTELSRFGYFAARIGRSAELATARLTVAFGEEKVIIERSLGPRLEIKELWRGKTKLHEPNENMWQDLAQELSGLGSHYDFHFVVRNFLFFLEDKVPLLWNPYGQFEILRILFLPKEMASSCADLHDKILVADSVYRNEHWHLTQQTERLQTLKDSYGSDATIRDLIDNLSATEARYQALREKIEDCENATTLLLDSLDNVESELFRADVALHDAYAELEKQEHQYFKVTFPDIQATGEIVYSDLLADRPCLVCGTVHHRGAKRIRELLREGKCPACETEGVGKKSNKVISFDEAKLRKLEEDVAALRALVEEKNHRRAEQRNELIRLQSELSGAKSEIVTLEVALNKARGAKDKLPQEVAILQAEIEKMGKGISEKREALKAMRASYEKTLNEASEAVQAVAQEVCNQFKMYAENFLVDSASLYYEMHSRSVGESGQRLSFPNFIVKMSSAVEAEPTSRSDSDQVSESQREFVDLAFRMALLNVAIAKHGAAMLVIETPEASLDTVFIERAGKMLREFAISRKGNKVIATCNLNGEEMISWLLGTEGGVPKKDRPAIDRRVINLLKEGRPTAGYIKSKEKYDKAFESAVYGK